jgi:hypothetical protein
MPNSVYISGQWVNGTSKVETMARDPVYLNRATRIADGVRISWPSVLAPDPLMRQHPLRPAASAYTDYVAH